MRNQTLAEQTNIEIILTEKNIQIAFNKEHGYLHCHWIGFQNKDSIMKSGEKILEILQKKGCSKVLNDNTLVTGPWHEAAEWTVTNWFPRMESAGLQHFAWIFSPNIFAELSAKKAMPNTGVVKSFYDIEAAKSWLIG
ncbi:MAG: hypothetical protein V4714_15685 [Bacteroidota bacterium]